MDYLRSTVSPGRITLGKLGRLDPRDRPIFAMRLAGTSPRDIAEVVGVGIAALNARIQAIVNQLVPTPVAA